MLVVLLHMCATTG